MIIGWLRRIVILQLWTRRPAIHCVAQTARKSGFRNPEFSARHFRFLDFTFGGFLHWIFLVLQELHFTQSGGYSSMLPIHFVNNVHTPTRSRRKLAQLRLVNPETMRE
jgi:hypothetical protein